VEKPGMNSIALDLHQTTVYMVAVTPNGETIAKEERITSATNLLEMVRSVSQPRQVVIEECHLAQWAKDVLCTQGEKVIVCDPRENHWISRAEHVNDASAATKLARLAACGYLKEIVHPSSDQAVLCSLLRTYYKAGHDVTRYKNRIKAVYRSVAIRASGSRVYLREHRQEWKSKLAQRPDLLLSIQGLYRLLDVSESMKRDSLRRLHALCRKHPAYQRMQTFPGAGRLIVCAYIALIVDPVRFDDEHKLWAYAGLGNMLHESGGTNYKKGCSRSGNRILKWLVMQHFAAITRRRDTCRFKRKYQDMVAQGHRPKDARRTVCRSILSTIRAAWLNGKDYDDDHIT